MIEMIFVVLFILSIIAWIVSLFFIKKTLTPMFVSAILVNVFSLIIQII